MENVLPWDLWFFFTVLLKGRAWQSLCDPELAVDGEYSEISDACHQDFLDFSASPNHR
jgi:hypothetical protein